MNQTVALQASPRLDASYNSPRDMSQEELYSKFNQNLSQRGIPATIRTAAADDLDLVMGLLGHFPDELEYPKAGIESILGHHDSYGVVVQDTNDSTLLSMCLSYPLANLSYFLQQMPWTMNPEVYKQVVDKNAHFVEVRATRQDQKGRGLNKYVMAAIDAYALSKERRLMTLCSIETAHEIHLYEGYRDLNTFLLDEKGKITQEYFMLRPLSYDKVQTAIESACKK